MVVISNETAKYALKNIAHRKMRTFLTILSIFVGITTIFIFISFGLGLFEYVEDFSTSGTADKLMITPKGSGAPGLDDTFALTDEDLDAVEKTSGIYEATGHYVKVAEIEKNKERIYTFVFGYDPDTPIIWEMFGGLGIYKGRWLESGDNKKVLLGYNYMIEDRIFSRPLEINDKIEIKGEDFRIVGFIDEVGNPQDDSQVYMLNEDVLELYEGDVRGYNMIIARMDIEDIDTVVENVEKNLRKSRDLEKGKEDFFVQSWQDMMELYTDVLNGIIGFIIFVALIAVVVSAINTANTMITSVLERYKEIGIMKAVGGKNSEIFKIFLFESAVLGFIAGCLGVALGWLLTFVAGGILNNIGWGFLSPYYSFNLFIGLIAFATITGAISGAIPAYKASKINPVEALRYE